MRPRLWLQAGVSRDPPQCAEASFSQQNEDAEDVVLCRRKLNLRKTCRRLEEEQWLGVLPMSGFTLQDSLWWDSGQATPKYDTLTY